MSARDTASVRVAAIAPNWLGDAVMSLPAMSVMAGAGGNVSLSVLASPYVARVFLGQPGIDELHVDPRGGRMVRISSRVQALRSIGPELAVTFAPSFSSALPAWFAGVRRRVGFRADARGILLTCALSRLSRDVHLTDSYVDLARTALECAGLEAGAPSAARIVVNDPERESVRRRLASACRDGYVVVVPGAAFGPAKAWPEERYRELCARLIEHIPVVLAGSSGDAAVCERIARAVPAVQSLAGRTSLGEMLALVEGARAVVANDSGAPHVAAALSVPCVVLFGSTSPAWTAPRGHDVRILQFKVHCNPCFLRTCPTNLECFNGIPVEDVRTAVMAFVDAPKKAGVAGNGLG